MSDTCILYRYQAIVGRVVCRYCSGCPYIFSDIPLFLCLSDFFLLKSAGILKAGH